MYTIDSHITLHIYTHWNAEQGPSFYGFATPLDKALFSLIITCSGIGPKLGLTALARLGSAGLIDSIQSGNIRLLNSINGIGTKKAEQLILHVKDKIPALATEYHDYLRTTVSLQTAEHWRTVQLTLESLHYSRAEIAQAIHHLKINGATSNSFDQLLRKALAFLSVKQT